MYERYYGLSERPFELTPNPRYLFLTRRHQEALSNLQHGVAHRKSLTLLLGPAGTGKTTLIRAALSNLAGMRGRCVTISNPVMTRDEFLQTLARGFDLSDDAARSKATLLVELEQRLRDRHSDQGVIALVVDEAQALPDELLEEIRLLVNLETETEKLLPIVLVGQPELAARLNEDSAYALKQRVALRCELAPLTLTETAQYIASRVRLAGGVPGRLFTREAVDLIYQRSTGIPRVISVICDNALLSGFAVEQRPVGRKIVLEVCSDFDFSGRAPSAPAGSAMDHPRPPAAAADGESGNRDARRDEPPAVDDPPMFGSVTGSRSWFSKLVATR